MTDVFISYKAEEIEEASWVKRRLEEHDITCWMAPASIRGGSSYAEEIPRAIRSARFFVLILSSKCQESIWVPRELDQAINEGKTVLPFMLENCPLRDAFSFYLTNVQRYAAYEDREAAVEVMAGEIRAVLDAERGAAAAAAVPAEDAPAAPEEAPREQPEEKPQETPGEKPEKQPEEKPQKTPGEKPEKQPEEKPQKTPAAKPEKKPREKAPKQPKEKPGKQPEQREKSGKKGKGKIVAPAAVGALVLIAVLGFVVGKAGRIEIAGEKFNKSDSYVTLREKSIGASDLAALYRFRELNSLYLDGCTLREDIVEFPADAVRYKLEIKNCGLTDEMLAAFPPENCTLKELVLDGNAALSDLSPLEALAGRLTALSFRDCAVSDLGFLKDFQSLTSLCGSGNRIADVSVLAGCAKLQTLELDDNKLTTLHPLSALTELRKVCVDRNKISDGLTGLENSISLTEIHADGNGLQSIEGLKNATVLSTVSLNDNVLYDVSLLAKSAESLKYLSLANNRLVNTFFNVNHFEELSGCVQVVQLDVSGNELPDLQPIAGWTNLQTLNASDNEIADVGALKQLTKLRELRLAGNKLETVTGLVFDEAATSVTLDLSHNLLKSLELPEKKYDRLLIYGNPITDFSALNGLHGNRLVLDYSDGLKFDAVDLTGFMQVDMFDCPLDRQLSVKDALSYHVAFITEEEYAAGN